MNYPSKLLIFILRISMGWLMFYAGITKVLNPAWTSAGYLKTAGTFSELFLWLASPQNIIWVDFVNKWGLTLLGVSLIAGVAVSLSSFLGAILMLLYYFPVLNFPMAGGFSYIVDEHIIYALILLLFSAMKAGKIWGLGKWLSGVPVIGRLS